MITTKQIQAALVAAGYSLDVDGAFGRKTRDAVKAFQQAHGLVVDGIVGPRTIRALQAAPALGGKEKPALEGLPMPPWMAEAERKMGLHEKADNAALKQFLASDGHALGDPAVLPWCGDFIETCIALTVPDERMVTNPYYALNWLKFGVALDEDRPLLGAVGVTKRDGGGHVFFLAGHDRTHWHALGGNQGNRVSIMKVAKDRTEGLRWPGGYPLPAGYREGDDSAVLPFSTFTGAISINEA